MCIPLSFLAGRASHEVDDHRVPDVRPRCVEDRLTVVGRDLERVVDDGEGLRGVRVDADAVGVQQHSAGLVSLGVRLATDDDAVQAPHLVVRVLPRRRDDELQADGLPLQDQEGEERLQHAVVLRALGADAQLGAVQRLAQADELALVGAGLQGPHEVVVAGRVVEVEGDGTVLESREGHDGSLSRVRFPWERDCSTGVLHLYYTKNMQKCQK